MQRRMCAKLYGRSNCAFTVKSLQHLYKFFYWNRNLCVLLITLIGESQAQSMGNLGCTAIICCNGCLLSLDIRITFAPSFISIPLSWTQLDLFPASKPVPLLILIPLCGVPFSLLSSFRTSPECCKWQPQAIREVLFGQLHTCTVLKK